ncbi:hypothetical protein PybrP1_009903 [[Pythium] brassicae (nom. inval.)]|nr:hypothetical protein PybrP1_009903 [[Pythium] brassicae (nom. inval.)]
MTRRATLLALASVFLTGAVSGQEEVCSGHGKVHGNHCHCEKGYTNKGLECLPTGGGSDESCAAGGIAWEASSLLFLEKGSYTIELVNNSESMAVFLLPIANVKNGAMAEALDTSLELADQLLEDITLARKLVKNNQVIAPTNKLLYVIARNNMEELERLKAECEAGTGNVWHIDHCDGPEGHGSRRLAVQPITSINMTVDASAHYALHLQHNAVEEFAMRILNVQGQPMSVLLTKNAEESEESYGDTAAPAKKATGAVWLKTMGAVAVVTIVSVVGIMLLVVKASLLDKLMDAFIALSAGALFGTGIIHILPESIEFYNEYGQMDLTICTVYIAGFMMAMLVEMLLELFIGQFTDGGDHHDHHAPLNLAASKDAAKALSPSTSARQQTNPDSASNEPYTDIAAIESAGSPAVQSCKSRWSLSVEWSKIKPMAYIILLGDLFHNFVDGVLIATAFLACDDSLGLAVMASAILHEIPQELADFIVLVDSGFTKFQAIVFNFISALSSFAGAFIILSAVTVTNSTMGLLLGFGAVR